MHKKNYNIFPKISLKLKSFNIIIYKIILIIKSIWRLLSALIILILIKSITLKTF